MTCVCMHASSKCHGAIARLFVRALCAQASAIRDFNASRLWCFPSLTINRSHQDSGFRGIVSWSGISSSFSESWIQRSGATVNNTLSEAHRGTHTGNALNRKARHASDSLIAPSNEGDSRILDLLGYIGGLLLEWFRDCILNISCVFTHKWKSGRFSTFIHQPKTYPIFELPSCIIP